MRQSLALVKDLRFRSAALYALVHLDDEMLNWLASPHSPEPPEFPDLSLIRPFH